MVFRDVCVILGMHTLHGMHTLLIMTENILDNLVGRSGNGDK